MAKGLEGIKTVKDFDFEGKNVFMRLDLNVPLKNGKVSDDTRIMGAMPTIRYCMEHGAKLVLSSHLGRPKSGGPEDRKKYSLEPVANRLNQLLGVEVILIDEPRSETPKTLLPGLKKNQIILLENLRFDAGEEKNDEKFASALASYTDIYINDAFGSSHRAHASIVGVPEKVAKKGIGFLIEKEISMLSKLLDNPKRPYVAILGGAKVSDKIDVIENLMNLVDTFIVGGAMAYTFLKARGENVGSSLVEADKLNFARDMMKRVEARGKSLLLPVDHVVSTNIEGTGEIRTTTSAAIDDGWMGVDVGPNTIKNYTAALNSAKTVFWNGPMGVFEKTQFAKGTFAIAARLAEISATTIVGGGDSAAAAQASGFANKMTHISTGGGASLEFLQGLQLPGIEVLRQKRR